MGKEVFLTYYDRVLQFLVITIALVIIYFHQASKIESEALDCVLSRQCSLSVRNRTFALHNALHDAVAPTAVCSVMTILYELSITIPFGTDI